MHGLHGNTRDCLSKETLTQNRQLVTHTLENFYRNLNETETEKATREMLGQAGSNQRVSLIALGVYIDLSSSFVKQTVIISKDELSQTSILMRTGSLLSVLLLATCGGLFYLGFSKGIIAKIPIDLWNQNPIGLFSVAIVDIIFMLAVVFLGAAASSLFWDTAIKGYANNKIIFGNMKDRVRDWLKEIIVGNIILGIILGLVLGI